MAFTLPDDISGLDEAALQALVDEATAEYRTVRDGEVGADELARLRELAANIATLNERKGEVAAAGVAAVAEIAELDAAVLSTEGEGDGGDGADGDEGDDDGDDGDDPADTVDTPDADKEPVTASARVPFRVKGRELNSTADDARKHTPTPDPNAQGKVTITAAGDIPGFRNGAEIPTVEALGAAMHNRARGLADGQSAPVATISTTRPDIPTIDDTMSQEQIDEVMKEVTDVEAMVASGGWCAPSQIRYDFFAVDAADGLLSLPTVNISRGGLRWPTSPAISEIFASPQAPWLWTEANDIASSPGGSPTKPCFRIPCPGFNEERLDAHGLCISHGNLSDKAYPELSRRYVSLVTNAHEHLQSMRFIADLVSQSVTVTGGANGGGVVAPVLSMVELQVVDYRLKYRMSENAVLEAVFPVWILPQMRADLARRQGVDMLSVPNSRLMAWFNDRNVRAQFVQDWQVGSSGFPGQATPATSWPTAVQFLIYAAGTFALGNDGEINLGVTRDSAMNATNDFTLAWMEEFHLIAKFGHEARRVIVPVCADGTVGLPADLPCPIA